MAALQPLLLRCALYARTPLNAALKACSNSIIIRHTANAKERLERAHKVMGISNQLSQQLEGIFNQWTKVRITDKEVRKLIQLALAPNKKILQSGKDETFSASFSNQCDAVLEYNYASPTQQIETAKGTVFGAYDAITGYFQNICDYKSEEAKLKSLLYGGAAQQKTQRAFVLCEAFSAHGSQVLFLN